MITLHIVTPCTRLENLQKLCESIKPGAEYMQINWWIVLDSLHVDIHTQRGLIPLGEKLEDVPSHLTIRVFACSDPAFIAGKGQINYALDRIQTMPSADQEYIYILDDDNIIYPNFFRWFSLVGTAEYDAIVMAQEVYSQGPMWIRYVSRQVLKETFIDQAQYILNRNSIGDERFIQKYTADGEFIERLVSKKEMEIFYNNVPYCYYNYLRRDEV